MRSICSSEKNATVSELPSFICVGPSSKKAVTEEAAKEKER
jgi:hypothetical protein